MKLIFAIFSTCCFVFCCKNKDLESTTIDTSSFFTNDFDTLKYNIREEEFVYPGDEKKQEKTTVVFSYPVYAGNDAHIDSFLNNEVNMLLENNTMTEDTGRFPKSVIVEKFFASYREYLSEKPDYIMFYQLENRIEPLHRFGSVVSMASNGFVFTGGAHPSHHTSYVNFDIDKKIRLKNSEFIDLNNTELLTMARNYFYVQNGVPKDSSLSSMGYFWEGDGHKDGEFYLNDNYAFIRDSAVWMYNSYEICAYSYGNPRISIPVKEMEKFIRR